MALIDVSSLPSEVTVINTLSYTVEYTLYGVNKVESILAGSELKILATTSGEVLYYIALSDELGLTCSYKQKKLDTPVIVKTDNTLTWDDIEDATSYTMTYLKDEVEVEVEDVTSPFDLGSLDEGDYTEIQIQAIAYGFISSDLSNEETYDIEDIITIDPTLLTTYYDAGDELWYANLGEALGTDILTNVVAAGATTGHSFNIAGSFEYVLTDESLNETRLYDTTTVDTGTGAITYGTAGESVIAFSTDPSTLDSITIKKSTDRVSIDAPETVSITADELTFVANVEAVSTTLVISSTAAFADTLRIELSSTSPYDLTTLSLDEGTYYIGVMSEADDTSTTEATSLPVYETTPYVVSS